MVGVRRRAGLREIVVNGVNGTLVDDGDFAGALARVPDYDPHAVARTGPAIRRCTRPPWRCARPMPVPAATSASAAATVLEAVMTKG